MLRDPSPITGLDWAGVLTGFAMFAVPALIALGLGFRGVTNQRIDLVTEAWGGSGSAEARSRVDRYLNRSRRFRAVGFAIGWSLPFVETIVRGTAYQSDSVVARGLYPTLGMAIFTGAIVLHEMTYRLRAPAASAGLERRSLRRYLPTWMLVAPVIAGAVAFALVILTLAIAAETMFNQAVEQVVAVSAMAVVLTIAYATFAAVAHRRQNLDSEAELSVDESSRTFGSEIVWRAAMGVALVTVGSVGWALDFVRSPSGGTWLPNWVMLVFVVCALAGYVLTIAAALPKPWKFKSLQGPVVAT